MKSYIKAIIIFNKNGEKRVVPLEQGVNIITGESKTGKSALVEIIDYCLCSTRCTIPKGKITDFSYLYSFCPSGVHWCRHDQRIERGRTCKCGYGYKIHVHPCSGYQY